MNNSKGSFKQREGGRTQCFITAHLTEQSKSDLHGTSQFRVWETVDVGEREGRRRKRRGERTQCCKKCATEFRTK